MKLSKLLKVKLFNCLFYIILKVVNGLDLCPTSHACNSPAILLSYPYHSPYKKYIFLKKKNHPRWHILSQYGYSHKLIIYTMYYKLFSPCAF